MYVVKILKLIREILLVVFNADFRKQIPLILSFLCLVVSCSVTLQLLVSCVTSSFLLQEVDLKVTSKFACLCVLTFLPLYTGRRPVVILNIKAIAYLSSYRLKLFIFLVPFISLSLYHLSKDRGKGKSMYSILANKREQRLN